MSSINCSGVGARPAERLFALVDCNNFYASCERLFRPDLVGKPIVVLSNNDGCIVSRSAEAKALGIGMAEPEFKVRSFLKQHNVAVFSSNYALYGDISQRVMATLESLCPQVEQYSIDEAFVRMDKALCANAEDMAVALRRRVQQWTGITVSVGIGPTRTLAKLANQLAKKHSHGVAFAGNAANSHASDAVLNDFPVGEVWGIGRKQELKCHMRGIRTALQLKNADDVWIKSALTVTGWQTAMELRGIACIGMEAAPAPRKTLVSSRSFAHTVGDKAVLFEALSTFTARAAERLRREHLVASGLAVHIRTAKHGGHAPYDESAQIRFVHPTSDTLDLMQAAQRGLDSLYKAGFAYAKAGVMLFGLEDRDCVQGNLLALTTAATADEQKIRQELNAALDVINHRYGKRALYYGAEGADKAEWHMRQEHRSPRATSNWNELARASAT